MGANFTAMTRRQALGLAAAATLWRSPASAAVQAPSVQSPPPRDLELTAGPLTMLFEPGLAFLRYIRLREREVIRGIYAAVRDRNWGTVAPHVTNLRVELREAAFYVDFDVECREGAINFFWKGSLRGDRDGTIRFTFDGQARSAFLRNRIGFCVLHPIRECAGQPCVVEKTGGEIERGCFPDFISPHQPFLDMRAISHTVVPGVTAEVRFEGDVFEMEDQRNWIDASYKTYCTPLARPFPVEVKPGARVSQAITLRLSGKPATSIPGPRNSGEVELRVAGTAATRLPGIGLGLAAAAPPLSSGEISLLKALRPAHLRADLNLADPGYARLLQRAAIGVPLEGAVFLSDAAEEELRGLARHVAQLRLPAARWLIFHAAERSTRGRWVRLARRHLSGEIGAGTNANFTELNRERPELDGLDVVCYSANPQVHAFDDRSLVETFEGLRDTVRTARQFSGAARLAVTPITFRPRFNPVATEPEKAPKPGEPPPQADPRQKSLFGAGWTLGCLQALAETGVDSVTFYETTGWGGVMEAGGGDVYPLYHVLAGAAEFAGAEVFPVTSSAPLEVAATALRKGGRTRLLVANLGPAARYLRISGAALGRRIHLRRMDERNVRDVTASPEAFRQTASEDIRLRTNTLELGLPPYGYACLDSARGR